MANYDKLKEKHEKLRNILIELWNYKLTPQEEYYATMIILAFFVALIPLLLIGLGTLL